jgi:hypothetical protein
LAVQRYVVPDYQRGCCSGSFPAFNAIWHLRGEGGLPLQEPVRAGAFCDRMVGEQRMRQWPRSSASGTMSRWIAVTWPYS